MAEFARWQWDDIGQWRDFAEQYQAEMEAGFQSRVPSIELTIPPHGTFRMELVKMEQVTVRGRNPGYTRNIRRQARRIEAGYFILGQEGEIFASDAAIDQIEALPALESMASLLARIVDEPEDFGRRSANLEDDEYCDTLGDCEEAIEFLQERGFEQIEDGGANFLVFMQEDVSGLRDALREVEARLDTVRRQRQQCSAASNATSNEQVVESNDVTYSNEVVESNDVTYSNEVVESNDVAYSNEVVESNDVTYSNEVAECPQSPTPASCSQQGCEAEGDVTSPVRFGGATPSEAPPSPARLRSLRLVLPSGETHDLELVEDTLEEALREAVKVAGFRLVALRIEQGDKPLGLGAEPGTSLCKVAGLDYGERLCVEDFEGPFVEKLSSGLLRLQDLASVAPLLAWEKPELPKMLLGRLRSLLEGSCDGWCKAAKCSSETELGYGRALLRLLYGDKPLEERFEVCKKLLPSEKRDEKTVLKVNRSDYMMSALTGLHKLSRPQLHKQFAVQFKGEVAEDHGGPRRDFFASFGSRLVQELPALWRRVPKGALVPVADLVAESSPKTDRLGFHDVQAVYKACGRVCALAARTGDVVGEEFAGFFLHQVARDDTVGLEELQRQLSESDGADDIRTKQVLLERNLSELGMVGHTLSRVITNTETEVDLVPGGREVPVTDDNKAEWLHLHLHDKLYGSLRKAADAFRLGLLDVLGGSRRTCPLLVLLSPAELARLWAGTAVGPQELRKWQEVTSVSNEVRQQAGWLWEILEGGDEAFRGRVLKFATGMHRLADGGLQTFEVQPADGGDESLPRAMTCANMLQLPRYTSKAILKQQLEKATELCDGFQVL